MIKLKPTINKNQTIKELRVEAKYFYYEAYEQNLCNTCFMEGVNATLKKLQIDKNIQDETIR